MLNREGEKLYNAVKEQVANRLKDVVLSEVCPNIPLNTVNSAGQESYEAGLKFLKIVQNVWEDHLICMRMIKDVLMYMDRVHVKSVRVPLIFDAGLTLFADNVVKFTGIGQNIVSVLLNCIRMERNSDVIDRSTLKAIINMLGELGHDDVSMYVEMFQPKLVEESTTYYKLEGEKLLRELSANDYLKHVQERLQQETERAQTYLTAKSAELITKEMDELLLRANMDVVANMRSGLFDMLEKTNIEDLNRAFKLFNRVDPNNKLIKRFLTAHIVQRGREVNSNIQAEELSLEANNSKPKPEDRSQTLSTSLKWVQEVSDLKKKYDIIVQDAMQQDRGLSVEAAESFSKFVNENPRSAEFISLFIDDNLKKGLKGKTDQETDEVLDSTIRLFRYIRDKDIFERYYKQHLGKRLVFNRSVSDDAERSMIAKLKLEVGAGWTQKLEGMVKDVRISQDMMADFKSHKKGEKSLDMSVLVLTSTYWPTSITGVVTDTCILPPELHTAAKSFEKFYLDRHSGRKLSWNCSMGNADIRVRFKSRLHELNVSTYAMIVLLLFNTTENSNKVTYHDILNATQIPEDELGRTLQSLACAKYKILLKEPRSRSIAPTDCFTFNYEFSAPQIRIRILPIAHINKLETETERRDTLDKVEDSRKQLLEAAIVRIMKYVVNYVTYADYMTRASKSLDHNNLIAETIKQLTARFEPSPTAIKARIESLIEREFLERDTADLRLYNYLA